MSQGGGGVAKAEVKERMNSKRMGVQALKCGINRTENISTPKHSVSFFHFSTFNALSELRRLLSMQSVTVLLHVTVKIIRLFHHHLSAARCQAPASKCCAAMTPGHDHGHDRPKPRRAMSPPRLPSR